MKSAYLDKKTYIKNLYGIGFLIAGVICSILMSVSIIGTILIVVGIYFILEHIWNFTVFELWDFFGHEWLGVYLIIVTMYFTSFNFIVLGLVLVGIVSSIDTGLHTMKPYMRKWLGVKYGS